MLSNIQQGSIVHILDKRKGVKYHVGEVVNKLEATNDFPNIQFGINKPPIIELHVKVGEELFKFEKINGTLDIVYYNNGNIIIAENKDNLTPIVENILSTNQTIVNNHQLYLDSIEDCKDVLKKLNPGFAKDQERDDSIKELTARMNAIDGKLEQMFNYIKPKANE